LLRKRLSSWRGPIWCLPPLMEPSGVAVSEWEVWFALAGMIDWGGGWLGSSWMWLSCRLRRAATDERLFPIFERAAKEKREGLLARVGVSVVWVSGNRIMGPVDEREVNAWTDTLSGVGTGGVRLAELAEDVCGKGRRRQRQVWKEERGTGPRWVAAGAGWLGGERLERRTGRKKREITRIYK
jgi:hypothetical protein